MKKVLNSLIAFVLVIALSAVCFPAQAIAVESTQNGEDSELEVLYAITTDSDIPYSDASNYGVVLPSALANTSELEQNTGTIVYDYLDSLLSSCDATQNRMSGDQMQIYNASSLNGVTIPNLESIVEISENENGYNLCYKTIGDEFVSIDYLGNGDSFIYVNPDGSADVVDENAQVIIFSSDTNSVSEMHFTPNAPDDMASAASAKQVNFPSPTSYGFSDTGASGTYTYHSQTVPYLGASRTVRLATVQTDFASAKTGWVSFAINIASTAIGAIFGLSATAIEIVLSLAGVVMAGIDGVKTIKEAIRIANTANYTALCGYYGDIYDSTAYQTYVRVVFNVISVKFAGGETASGGFTYVKQYPVNGPTASGTISKTVTNYNSALVLGNGYNSAYTPPI